jgi:glycosyltransferase involved in cell wall biosynthesis
VWRLAERKGFATQKHLISINPYVKEKIAGKVTGRIHEINNPLDERFFHMHREEQRIPRVLCVGWISPRKNTLSSVRAFGKAIAAGCKGTLVIAGSAPDPEYLVQIKQEIEILGIAGQVEFLGHVGHDRLATELSLASVFLLPSLQENAPMAIAEAMAVGVPVVASNRCGMPYMIDHGTNGFLVDPENIGEIAGRLTSLLGDEALRREFGSHARASAVSMFHPREVLAQTLQVYRSIIGKPEAGEKQSVVA